MSSQREQFHSSQPRTTRSPPTRTQDSAFSSTFAIGQGGRSSSPLTPPSIPTSRSPAPIAPNAPLNPRQYAQHYETAVGIPSEWPSYGMPSQVLSPGRGSSYGTLEQSGRHVSPHYASHSRATPAPTSSSHSSRHSGYPANPQFDLNRYQYSSAVALEPEQAHYTSGYEYGLDASIPTHSSYVYASPTDASPVYHYAPTPAYEPRNFSSQAMFTNALPSAALVPPMGPASRSVASAVRGATRSHAHTPHHAPYTVPSRSRAPINSASADSSVGDMIQGVKKKRKRADAHQLKVLNEVYDRNPFPPTVEREQLAQQLGMTPRSVQIWFQNKRQAARQGGRGGQPPKTSEGSTSISEQSAGHTSSRHSHPNAAGSTHAGVIEAPSASAPRGAPGYVASPTLRPLTSSPHRPASAPYQPQTVFVEAYQPPAQSHGVQLGHEQAGPSTRSTKRHRS